jgi:hypothetical protein
MIARRIEPSFFCKTRGLWGLYFAATGVKIWLTEIGRFGYFGPGEKRTDVDIFDFVQDKLRPVGTERHDSGFSRSDNP